MKRDSVIKNKKQEKCRPVKYSDSSTLANTMSLSTHDLEQTNMPGRFNETVVVIVAVDVDSSSLNGDWPQNQTKLKTDLTNYVVC